MSGHCRGAARGIWILIERDNRTGDFGVLKTLVSVEDAALADGRVENSEKKVFDLRPSLLCNHGWITDKPEGCLLYTSPSPRDS